MRSLFVALPLVLAGSVHAERLQFQLPPGFTDLVPASADTTGYSADMVKTARNGRYRVFAASKGPRAPGTYQSNMNAVVEPGAQRIDIETLEKVATALEGQFKVSSSKPAKRVDVGVRKIENVDVGRIVLDAEFGLPVRALVYLIPSGDRTAMVSFFAARDRFDDEVAAFDAAALATKGALPPPPRFRWDWKRSLLVGTIGGLLALGISRLRKRWAARKSEKAA